MTIGRPIEFDPDVALDAAMNLFWRKGYESSSLHDLLATMKLSKSSFYQTFNSKHDLFKGCFYQYHKMVIDSLESQLKQAASGKAFIENIFHSIVAETVGENARRGCLLVNTAIEFAQTDPEIAKLVSDGIDDLTNIFETAIKQGQQQRDITTTKDARAMAIYLVSSISGLRTMVKAGADRETIRRIGEITLLAIV